MAAQALILSVPREQTAQIRDWQHQINHDVLRYQIESRGAAVVLRYRDREQLHRLQEVPEVGEADPWYGDVGGGYRFEFIPDTAPGASATDDDMACTLVVHSTVSNRSLFYDAEIRPLRLRLARGYHIEELALTGEMLGGAIQAHYWGNYPGLYPEIDTIVFGIQGPAYANLVEWGWRPETAGNYYYSVTPLSVATPVQVTDPLTWNYVELESDIEEW